MSPSRRNKFTMANLLVFIEEQLANAEDGLEAAQGMTEHPHVNSHINVARGRLHAVKSAINLFQKDNK